MLFLARLTARHGGIERTHSDQRRSTRRLPALNAPADVSDAVASLLQLPSRGSTTNEGESTSVGGSDKESPFNLVVASVPDANHGKARHNATERRRVHNLKCAYMELDEVVRSRPDLVRVKPMPEESAGRRRSRNADRGDEASSSSSSRPQPGP